MRLLQSILTLPLLGAVASAQETVVTSTRVESRVEEQPRALEVVGGEDLVARSVRTTPEALAEVEGVYVQKTGQGGGAPIIRGLYGQQVLLLVDGVRMNNATVRAGPNQLLNTVDPFLIDQIEVLRGPGSVLYGSDALGGVVNVRTFWPRFSGELRAGGMLSARGATADTSLQGHLRATASLESTAVAVAATGRDFNDLRGGARIGLQPYTGYEEWDFTAKLRQRVAPGQVALFQYQAVRQSNAPRLDRSAPGDFRRFTEQYRDLFHGRYEQSTLGPLEQLSLELTAHRQGDLSERFRVARDRIDRDAAGEWTFGVRGEASARPSLLGGGATVTFGADSFHGVVGGHASRARVSDPAAVTAAPLEARYLFGSSTLSSGAFARAFTDPRAPLAGYLGLRGQLNRVVLPEDARLHELFAASAAPPPILPAADLWTPGFAAEAGLSYRPVEAVMLVLNLGSGFRSPNIDDYTRMGAEGPGFLVPGRDLSPEQSYTGEVGIRVSHPLVRLQAFYALTAIPGLTGNVPTTLDGQAFTPDGVPYLTRLNRERATIHAIDGSVEVTPVPRLALAASAGFLASAQVRRDLLAPGEPLITEPLSRQPPLNGTVKARFTPAPWLFAEGLVRWAAAQRAISSSDRLDNRICFEAPSCAGTPGYAAVHLRAGATIGQGISVGLSLLNLLDATYRVHGSGVDEPGRSVAASVEVRL